MPFLTNPKREAFAQAYVRGATAGKPAESYLAAGYRVRRKWASVSASRLMQEADVRRRIAELQTELAARPGAESASPTGSTQTPQGDPMPALDNAKHEAFAQAFVRGETAGDRCHSYLAVYGGGHGSAKTCGARLAKQPDVMRRIAELKQEMQASEQEASERATARLAITKEAVLAELARIAFANILDYGKPDDDGGFTFDLAKLDRDKAAAIQEIVITPAAGGGTDGTAGSTAGGTAGGKPKSRIRVKLAPKRDALVDLGRHFGLFVARDKGAADEFADLSEEELAARIRIVVAELQRSGIDVASLFGLAEADGGERPKGRPH